MPLWVDIFALASCIVHWDICPTWSLSQLRGALKESGSQACLCWFWTLTLHHLVGLHSPNLGSLGTLFSPPSKSTPPTLSQPRAVWSYPFRLSWNITPSMLIFPIPRDAQVLPWGPLALCSYNLGHSHFLYFHFKFTSLSLWLLYKSLMVMSQAPFIFALPGLFIIWHILNVQ